MNDWPRPLRATYRLQLTPDFGFAAAGAQAHYLRRLGVSHAYLSPVFAARPGSTHGYDGIDHNRLNPELGSEADFAAMCAAFRAEGLGIIADFVPNHVGIGGAANRMWASLLEWGRCSPYAHWFDVDWCSSYPGLRGKVLVPVLGKGYGGALADGAMALRFDAEAGGFTVWAHETHALPVRPEDYADILARAPALADLAAAWRAASGSGPDDPRLPGLRAALREAPRERVEAAVRAYAGLVGDPETWSALDALLSRQNWRAARHTLDADAINYRRFFTISDLAGLRVEDATVFDALHELIFELIDRGAIDGVRIDHIDGLRDPKGYLLRLRDKAPRPIHLFVEKILADDERLRDDWGADGTTGYEVANALVGLFVDRSAEAALTACCAEFTGVARDPDAEARAAKIAIMRGPMAAEVDAVVRRLHEFAEADPATRDLGPNALREALIATIAAFDVYRTYADADGLVAEDRARIADALTRARPRAIDPEAIEFLGRVLTLERDVPEAREIAFRTQQLTGPVMAKGFEDTALYRLPRLIALNEVGGEPGRFGLGVTAFHAANAERLARAPRTLLATSTHDTKRGEDARIRIAAISWRPTLWRESVFAWREMLYAAGAPPIDAEELYFFFQLLLGAWPVEWDDAEVPTPELSALRERVAAGMLKSVREAGRNTRWIAGDEAHEAKVTALVEAACDPGGAFLASFRETAAVIGPIGTANALAQTALKLTVPGTPDIYQGAEFWEQSLVDPDNRRAVDFAARDAALRVAEGNAAFPGSPRRLTATDKTALTARLLALRRERPGLFAVGAYEPLIVGGPSAHRICAFVRRDDETTLLVAAALGWVAGGDLTGLSIPELSFAEGWRNPLGPESSADAHAPFAETPVYIRASS